MFTTTQHLASCLNGKPEDKESTHRLDSSNFALAGCSTHAGAVMIVDDEYNDESVRYPSEVAATAANSVNCTSVERMSKIQMPFGNTSARSENSSGLYDQHHFSSETPDVIAKIVDKLRLFSENELYSNVLATFDSLGPLQKLMPAEAFNLAIQSASKVSSKHDVSVQLELYEKLLKFNIEPNVRTYTLLITDLVNAATNRQQTVKLLSPLFGLNCQNSGLSSVDQVYRSLAPEEPLIISMNILNAVLSCEHDMPAEFQPLIGNVLTLCAELAIEPPHSLLSHADPALPCLITLQPDLESAELVYNKNSHDELAQKAFLNKLFSYNQVNQAVQLFDQCGAPDRLLTSMYTGFARNRLVGTCRSWIQNTNADSGSIAKALASIPLANSLNSSDTPGPLNDGNNRGDGNNSSDILPSAAAMFNRFIALNGTEKIGRDAFINICIAGNSFDRLLMCIRESKLSNSVWDAVTTKNVLQFVIANNEPQLAADIASWQISKLDAEFKGLNVKSSVCQELADSTISELASTDKLDALVALRLLPLIRFNSQPLIEALPSLHKASMNQLEPEVIKAGLLALANFSKFSEDDLTSAINAVHEVSTAMNCSYTPSEQSVLSEILSADFVSVHEEPASVDETASELIRNYANINSGLDSALELFSDTMLLRKQVSLPAIQQLLQSVIRNESADPKPIISQLFERVEKTPAMLDVFITECAAVDNELTEQAVSMLKQKSLFPSLNAYVALIKGSKSSTATMALLDEAKHAKGVNMDVYNAAIVNLSVHDDLPSIELLIEAVKEVVDGVEQLSIETIENVLQAYTRSHEYVTCLTRLEQLTKLQRSLLNVHVYNELMNGFVGAKDKQAAFKVYAMLLESGTLATSSTYETLIRTHLIESPVYEPDLHEADNVILSMKQSGTPISTQCFAALLRARGVQFKDLKAAQLFYRGLVKNSRVKPDEHIFRALLDSYETNGKHDEVDRVFDEMKRYHVPI